MKAVIVRSVRDALERFVTFFVAIGPTCPQQREVLTKRWISTSDEAEARVIVKEAFNKTPDTKTIRVDTEVLPHDWAAAVGTRCGVRHVYISKLPADRTVLKIRSALLAVSKLSGK